MDVQFCSYFEGTKDDCENHKQHLSSQISSFALPVLLMGNPSDPVLYMFHGWPDTAAMWANQMIHFCAPPYGTYYCISPSIIDFHPNAPPANVEDHEFDVQLRKYRTLLSDLNITKVNLMGFGWGSVFA